MHVSRPQEAAQRQPKKLDALQFTYKAELTARRLVITFVPSIAESAGSQGWTIDRPARHGSKRLQPLQLFQLKKLSERLSDPFASSLLLRQTPGEVLQNCAQLVWCRSV